MKRYPRRCAVSMNAGAFGSSSRAPRNSRMVTLRTASPTKVSGQTAARSSTLVTSCPERPTSWLSTAYALGLSLITCEPLHRHSLDWSKVEQTEHKGERGFAYWRTQQVGSIRVRIVEYTSLALPKRYCTFTASL